MMERLSQIRGLTTAMPQGAFYVLPDVSSHFGKTAPDGTVIGGPTDLCLYLLRYDTHGYLYVSPHVLRFLNNTSSSCVNGEVHAQRSQHGRTNAQRHRMFRLPAYQLIKIGNAHNIPGRRISFTYCVSWSPLDRMDISFCRPRSYVVGPHD